jgi:hypothetical protein
MNVPLLLLLWQQQEEWHMHVYRILIHREGVREARKCEEVHVNFKLNVPLLLLLWQQQGILLHREGIRDVTRWMSVWKSVTHPPTVHTKMYGFYLALTLKAPRARGGSD